MFAAVHLMIFAALSDKLFRFIMFPDPNNLHIFNLCEWHLWLVHSRSGKPCPILRLIPFHHALRLVAKEHHGVIIALCLLVVPLYGLQLPGWPAQTGHILHKISSVPLCDLRIFLLSFFPWLQDHRSILLFFCLDVGGGVLQLRTDMVGFFFFVGVLEFNELVVASGVEVCKRWDKSS